jgi:MFS transporter, OFA family, oxalate/formate antiporter
VKLESKRWFILLMGILANMCMGAAYASSVFAKPILLHLGLTKVGAAGALVPNMALWANAFSINLACLPVGMLLSGKIADRKSPRVVVIGGGILFGLGMFLCGFTNSINWLYIFFGVIMGIGSGAAYGAIVSASVRWFPDMRGLASGLAVGALGFGTLIIAPVASYLMTTVPSGDVPVLWAFRVLGIAFLVIIALGGIVIKNPPVSYKPANWVPKASAQGSTSVKDFTWVQLLGKMEFWVLYVMYISGAFSGLMIISQASPIAQTMAKLTPAVAVGIVASMGLSNALGRVFWGFISDKIGRLGALLLMFAATSAVMFALPAMALAHQSLLIAVLLVSACYGGYLGIFPSVCADYFGPKNLTVNYALLFSAFSIAAIAGPMVGARIFLKTGSYANAFVIAGVVSAAGGLLTIISLLTRKKTA